MSRDLFVVYSKVMRKFLEFGVFGNIANTRKVGSADRGHGSPAENERLRSKWPIMDTRRGT